MRYLQNLVFIGDDHVCHGVVAILEIVISPAIYLCKTSLSSMAICPYETFSPPTETDGHGAFFPENATYPHGASDDDDGDGDSTSHDYHHAFARTSSHFWPSSPKPAQLLPFSPGSGTPSLGPLHRDRVATSRAQFPL